MQANCSIGQEINNAYLSKIEPRSIWSHETSLQLQFLAWEAFSVETKSKCQQIPLGPDFFSSCLPGCSFHTHILLCKNCMPVCSYPSIVGIFRPSKYVWIHFYSSPNIFPPDQNPALVEKSSEIQLNPNEHPSFYNGSKLLHSNGGARGRQWCMCSESKSIADALTLT